VDVVTALRAIDDRIRDTNAHRLLVNDPTHLSTRPLKRMWHNDKYGNVVYSQ
jgi:hypothetical protein